MRNIMQCHVMNRITPSLHTSCVYTHTYMCIHQVLQLFSATEIHGVVIATYITKQLTTKTYAEDAAAYWKAMTLDKETRHIGRDTGHSPVSIHQLAVHHACTWQVNHDCWNVHQTRCGACTCPPTTCLLMDWWGRRWSNLYPCHQHLAQIHCFQPQPADRHCTEVANLQWKAMTTWAYL